MKKIVSFVSAALLVCSCTNEIDNVVGSSSKKIQFDPYIAGNTRALVDAPHADATTVKNEGFRVVAWYKNANEVLFNDLFKYSESNHQLAGTEEYEWPKSTDPEIVPTLDFYAVYPKDQASIEFATSEGGQKVITDVFYVNTTSNSSNGQSDVLLAQAKGKTQNDGKVALSFQHVLTQVRANLKFDATYDETNIYVNEISLTGLQSGFYDMTNSSWVAGYKKDNEIQPDTTSARYILHQGSATMEGSNTTSIPVFSSLAYNQETEELDTIPAAVMLIPGKYELSIEYIYKSYTMLKDTVDLSDPTLQGKIVTLDINVKDNRISFGAPQIVNWDVSTSPDYDVEN